MKRVLLASLLVLGVACADENESATSVVLIDEDAGHSDTGGIPDDSDRLASERCPWQDNQVCDEPSRCPLGTDETDCQRSCEAGGPALAFFAAACAHRNLLSLPGASQVSAAPTVGVGSWTDGTLNYSDDQGRVRQRAFRTFRPLGVSDSDRLPVLLMLPGNRVSHLSLPDYTELDATAVASGIMVVYVEQPWRDRFFSWSWYTDWNWADDAENNPDLIFLRQLIEHLGTLWNVDGDRVYLAGHSRGAAMSVIAALEMPDLVAGAIPQSGFVEFGYFDRMAQWEGSRRPRFYFVHGAVDDDVCIDCIPGGRCGVTPTRSCGTVAGSDALVDRLKDLGWDESNLHYARLERVAHRWQPWLNQIALDFIGGTQPEVVDP